MVAWIPTSKSKFTAHQSLGSRRILVRAENTVQISASKLEGEAPEFNPNSRGSRRTGMPAMPDLQ